MSRKFKKWLVASIFCVGLIIALIGLLSNPLIQNMGNEEVDNMTPKKVEASKRKPANFDYSSVKMLNPASTTWGTAKDFVQGDTSDYAPVGKVAIPNVSLRLPIGKGLGHQVLSRGAGTMSEDQQMGQGNYAMAGHYMTNTQILFSPLKRVKIGDMIYLTDMQKVYRYRTYSKRTVPKNEVEVLKEVAGKKVVTLITCASPYANEPNRIVVKGELVGTSTDLNQYKNIFG
ncbi:class A sortase [Pediococcus inopinatus]|jgi:sortase A|uniref:Class A sortase n=1 Tax=Pediococcus inopinatus TaxID=114090 RepID=A0ABZ0Q3Y5_9LACO|nr:class A sortase [Pediococcus inopinatus]KRN61753.1 sortase A [Pediococcus inopinatus]WPC16917.1 class A sortase [Pediococcus inopinatus]WPC19965.1 class A sortase [Pediococcus inopinatus]WPC21667.1 class A sortase [Pediococcus inopinatus]WPP09403.1 class A sortase [Pediococcus inopinatus]